MTSPKERGTALSEADLFGGKDIPTGVYEHLGTSSMRILSCDHSTHQNVYHVPSGNKQILADLFFFWLIFLS